MATKGNMSGKGDKDGECIYMCVCVSVCVGVSVSVRGVSAVFPLLCHGQLIRPHRMQLEIRNIE